MRPKRDWIARSLSDGGMRLARVSIAAWLSRRQALATRRSRFCSGSATASALPVVGMRSTTSVISIMPTGRPAASMTGSSLIFCCAITETASLSSEPVVIVRGDFVITCRMPPSSSGSRLHSSIRARSLSVKIPTRIPSASINIVAPVRRAGLLAWTSTSRTVPEASAIRQSESRRITSSTLASFLPRLPPGWNLAKSSRRTAACG